MILRDKANKILKSILQYVSSEEKKYELSDATTLKIEKKHNELQYQYNDKKSSIIGEFSDKMGPMMLFDKGRIVVMSDSGDVYEREGQELFDFIKENYTLNPDTIDIDFQPSGIDNEQTNFYIEFTPSDNIPRRFGYIQLKDGDLEVVDGGNIVVDTVNAVVYKGEGLIDFIEENYQKATPVKSSEPKDIL